MNIGFIGLGNMGGALARRLLLTQKLRVHDLNPGAVDACVGAGADSASSPAELAAASDVVMTCLPTSADVRSVVFGNEGLVEGLGSGNVVVDMTTGDPAETRAMASELHDRGIDMIDAPVSGGPQGADAGTIAIMVGGPETLFQRCRPIFEAISSNVFHAGPNVGDGHTMKLINNMMSAGNRAVAFEAVTLAVKNGLDAETCVGILQKSSGRSNATDIVLPRFVLSGVMDQGFSLGLMLKDVALANKLGGDSETPLLVAALVRQILQAGVNEFGPDADINMLIRLFEDAAKTEVPKGG